MCAGKAQAAYLALALALSVIFSVGQTSFGQTIRPEMIEKSVRLAVAQDPDFRRVGQIVTSNMSFYGWPRIRNDREYESAVDQWIKLQYYAGRIETKNKILAGSTAMSREYETRLEIVRRYAMTTDQRVMVPPLEQSLSGLDFRMAPKERFARQLYNAYLQNEQLLSTWSAELFRRICLYIFSNNQINKGNPAKTGEEVYRRGVAERNKGVYDAGGMSDLEALVANFSLKVLVPVFESAKRSNRPPTPEEAAARVISFFSQIGR